MSHLFAIKDTEAGRSLLKKLNEQGKPNSLILLNEDEWLALKDMHILPLSDVQPEGKADGEGVKA